jgi:hypothetical protein
MPFRFCSEVGSAVVVVAASKTKQKQNKLHLCLYIPVLHSKDRDFHGVYALALPREQNEPCLHKFPDIIQFRVYTCYPSVMFSNFCPVDGHIWPDSD